MSNLASQAAGNLGSQLMEQLKRNPDMIPPFHHELMKACTDKINELYNKNYQEMIGREDVTTTVQVRQAAINRVRRCCLNYLHEREKRVKSLRWKFGQIPPKIKPNLAEFELDFFNEYSNGLAEFQTSLSAEAPVDITENMHPPKVRYVEVRALQDYGEFETSKGDNMLLFKDQIYSLPIDGVAPLVKQGILEYCNE